ncbi:serine hydrolase domain-containing protein [Kitasatospora sp. NPDC057692]|uniref:serine hydrolase domain-containing protein n=1 Tax=Kitasatospora sp. NPDC057692 TaxID=3346215 RepID=UPI0036BEC22B
MNVIRTTSATRTARSATRTGPHAGRLAAVALAGAAVVALAPTAAVAADGDSRSAAIVTADAAARVDLGPELRAVVERGASTAALGEARENGRRVWRDSAGVTDIDSQRPVRADGRFRIGSVTKTFVSTVVLQLVDEGKLRLDDPVEHYLPGLVPNGGAITLRQLLNHTSGLYDYLDDPRFLFHDEASLRSYLANRRWTTWSPAQLIEVGVQGTPYFAPGQGWHYSNTNYVLLGELVRKVTGRAWQSEVDRRIVKPLHLDETTFQNTRTAVPGPHAHGYVTLPEGLADVTRLSPSFGDAAGNGISTGADLNRFHAALFGGRLLSPARLAEMTTAVPAPMIGAHYGLGLIRYDLPCGEVWGHTGGLPGYNTVWLGAKDGTRQFSLSFNLSQGSETEETFTTLNAFIVKASCGSGAVAGTGDAAANPPLKTLR